MAEPKPFVRGQIFEYLVANGPQSRKALSAALNISRVTLSTLLWRLTKEGRVIATGFTSARRFEAAPGATVPTDQRWKIKSEKRKPKAKLPDPLLELEKCWGWMAATVERPDALG